MNQSYTSYQRTTQRSKINNPYKERLQNNTVEELNEPTPYLIVFGFPYELSELELSEWLYGVDKSITKFKMCYSKETNDFKGYIYLKFESVEDSVLFVENNLNKICYHENHKLRMHFSNNDFDVDGWECFKCNFFNYKKREMCLQCATYRPNGKYAQMMAVNDGTTDIGTKPNNMLLIRFLRTETQKETIYKIFENSAKRVLAIKNKQNNEFKGFCFMEFENTKKSSEMLRIVNDQNIYSTGFFIEETPVSITYAHENSFIESDTVTPYTINICGRNVVYWDAELFADCYTTSKDTENTNRDELVDVADEFIRNAIDQSETKMLKPKVQASRQPKNHMVSLDISQYKSLNHIMKPLPQRNPHKAALNIGQENILRLLVDKEKLICYLCERRFKSIDDIILHLEKSERHTVENSLTLDKS